MHGVGRGRGVYLSVWFKERVVEFICVFRVGRGLGVYLSVWCREGGEYI